MKKILSIGFVCIFSTQLCPAELLTSFTDDFNRAELGENYTAPAEGGSAYNIINDSGVVANGGSGQNLIFLNKGDLPTEADYANGYRFTATLDLFIPDAGPTAVPTAGILLEGQNAANFWAVRFRGHSDSPATLQLYGRVSGPEAILSESKPLSPLANNTWYTLKVSSAAAGVYEYTFSEQGSTTPIIEGTFTAENIGMGAGGAIGLYSDNAEAGAYQFDNFSVSVEKGARKVENK
jgi:hypothetical protein